MRVKRSRRKFSNVKLTQKWHAQYLGWWVVLSLVLVLLLDAAVYVSFEQMWNSFVPQGADPAFERAYRQTQVIAVLVVTTLIFSAAILLLAVLTSHRIAGPYLRLMRTFEQVAQGDFNQRLKFRDYDNLDDVADAFNAMMDELERRHEARPSEYTPPRLRAVGE